MGLITKEVEVGLIPANIKYYENLGYEIPRRLDNRGRNKVKRGTKIIVRVENLQDCSIVKVDIECNGCGKKLKDIKWQQYKKGVKENGEYYCKRCAIAGYKKWISFYEWCYENLSKEEANKIMERWDYDKNKISPKDVSYGSDKIGYWFKCLDYPEHESELKSLNDFTSGQKGSIKCRQCNTLRITHPHLVKFLVNENDADKYSKGSGIYIPMKCPNCGYQRDFLIYTLTYQKFVCPRCSDGISYSQKFIFNILEQLNVNFVTELSKTVFKWCTNYRYDFYIPIINGICEAHGIQHYKEIRNWNPLKEIQENDKNKEQLAKYNGINHYIVLDCRHSEMEWIKSNIMKSKLPILLNFKEKDINWLKAHEAGLSNLIKICSDLWSKGIKNTIKIAKLVKLGHTTVVRYLKQGVELGWCDYDPKEVLKSNKEYNYKKIICLTTNEIFNSIKEAEIKYNFNSSGIIKCCKGKQKYAGKHPVTNQEMVWQYCD